MTTKKRTTKIKKKPVTNKLNRIFNKTHAGLSIKRIGIEAGVKQHKIYEATYRGLYDYRIAVKLVPILQKYGVTYVEGPEDIMG